MLNPGDVGWSSQTWNGLTRVAFGWSSSVKRRDVTHDWADCALTDSETNARQLPEGQPSPKPLTSEL